MSDQHVQDIAKQARDPSLWRGAFLEGGGDAKLVMLEPEGKDGHAMFSTAGGRANWLPEMDGMLRFLKLPTWTRVDVNELMKKLGANEHGRAFVERYIAAPSEKALAREKGGTYMSQSSGWANDRAGTPTGVGILPTDQARMRAHHGERPLARGAKTTG